MKTNANSNTIETACAIAGKEVQAPGVEAALKSLDALHFPSNGGRAWLDDVKHYEKTVLSTRG